MENKKSQVKGIPPLFSDTFSSSGFSWIRIDQINTDLIGRLLSSHLILEHYIDNLLAITYNELNWSKGNLTFAQKQKLITKIPFFEESNFARGAEIVNRIRNKFSHNLLATADKNLISELKDITDQYLNSIKTDRFKFDNDLDDIETVEYFVNIICSCIAGYCTAKAMHKFSLQKSSPSLI